MAQDLWENRDQALAALETGGIGAASALTVGGVTYGLLTRRRRELMREWVFPLHEALALPLRLPEQTDPRRYLHIPKNFSDDAAEIRVDVPGRLDFSRDLIADLLTQKPALEGVTGRRRLPARPDLLRHRRRQVDHPAHHHLPVWRHVLDLARTEGAF
ncbi:MULTISPECIES: hypothetical protein [unclassified Streptomyces]|uniref:hypothetical protein n=1 Tax=unclassified Streptomyces TaxID=2593676 RepID=UPI002E2C3DD5|nr:hypothetical protein [Streptomyces sp. NBC_00272]